MSFGIFLIIFLSYNQAAGKRVFYIVLNSTTKCITKLIVEVKEIASSDEHLLEFEFIGLFTYKYLPYWWNLLDKPEEKKDPNAGFLKINKRDYKIKKENFQIKVSKIKTTTYYIKYDMVLKKFNYKENDDSSYYNFLLIDINKDKVGIKIKERLSDQLFVTETNYLREFEELFDLELKKVPTPTKWLNISTRAKRRGYSFLWSTVGLLSGTIISTFIGFMRQSNIWRF